MIKNNNQFLVKDESENFYGFKADKNDTYWGRLNENPTYTFNRNNEMVLGRWTDFKFNGAKK